MSPRRKFQVMYKMDHREAGRYWEQNAENWTKLVRQGYDVYRDYVNTPAFMKILPDVDGLLGLDIGCGEGCNTRRVAEQGAQIIALDIAPVFCQALTLWEQVEPCGLSVINASGLELPFANASFDFATAFMSIMDMPQQETVLAEVYRILKPGGFFQFSITHPCFSTRRRKWVHDDEGNRIGVVCGDYYNTPQGWVEEWLFGSAPAEVKAELAPFRVPRFDHTLSWWLNTINETGFILEYTEEPKPTPEAVAACHHVADELIVPNFIIFRCRKSG